MDAKEPRRKARTIMASDSEWIRIRGRAEALDMPISRFVVQQALATTTAPQVPDLPADLKWRLAHHLMVLGRIERHRLENAGKNEAWQAIEEEVEALLEAEASLDRKGTRS